MIYRKFYISITESDEICRTDYEGKEITCEGFNFEVYPKENRTQKIDEFSAAVGFEILEKSLPEAEQFVKDHIDLEGAELKGFINETCESESRSQTDGLPM
ncbi:MAG: hypothetical protein IJ571_03235 [Ruminococcus sp.]|nr:hypothetical protein [Ruminococcus sp.]